LALGLLFASAATAAPSFRVEVSHSPTAINRGDERIEFTVQVTNGAAAVTEPRAGEVFTCNPNTWSPAGAATHPTFSYQWLRDGSAILAAAASSYKLQAADEGHSIQCQVFGTNANATTTAVTAPIVVSPAPATMPPAPSEPTNNNSRPIVTGTGAEGVQRTCAAPSGWSGVSVWSYQWLINGQPVAGAISETFTPTGFDGKVLQCEVVGENVGGKAAGVSLNNLVGTLSGGAPTNSAANTPGLVSPAATSGTTSLAVALAPGLKLEGGSSGVLPGVPRWVCHASANSCTNEGAVGPGQSFPDLTLAAWVLPESAPDVLTTTFTAFGGGASSDSTAQDTISLGPEAAFGVTSFSALAEQEGGIPFTQAAGHPFSATTAFELARHAGPFGTVLPTGSLRDTFVNLPAGFIGNPQAVPVECSVALLTAKECPEASSVGGVDVEWLPTLGQPLAHAVQPVYKIPAEKGYPAEFVFQVASAAFVVRAQVRSDGDYGLTAVAPLTPQQPNLLGARFTFCGFGAKTLVVGNFETFQGCKSSADPSADPTPFLRNPTKCAGGKPVTTLDVDSFEQPAAKIEAGFPDPSDPNWRSYKTEAPAVTGCEALTEAWTGTGGHANEPSFSFQPDVTQADTPSGYSVDLHVPQDGLTEADGLATADLDGTTVTLPAGVALSPSAANGLRACSEAQMGLTSESPLHFNLKESKCPGTSKIGTL